MVQRVRPPEPYKGPNGALYLLISSFHILCLRARQTKPDMIHWKYSYTRLRIEQVIRTMTATLM
jgi:hypothetical protein